jgi:hypothetical protein
MKQIRDEKKRQSRSSQSGALSSYNQIQTSCSRSRWGRIVITLCATCPRHTKL